VSAGSIETLIEQHLAGKEVSISAISYLVNLISPREGMRGACLVDTGAQANIENDISCFIDHIEPSDVVLGLASSSAQLKNCGYGTRERRFRDLDGNVYVYRDKAYYCPDAAYPIMSAGVWEENGACLLFNPSNKFRTTSNGRKLPGGNIALIVDKTDRVLVLRKVPDVPRLWWLTPIQPTTVSDVESNALVDRNRRISSTIMQTLNETADACSMDVYATRVQELQRQLEEAHLLHSQLFGSADEDNKACIASAHELISSIDFSNRGATYDAHTPSLLSIKADLNSVCTRCRHNGCSADSCVRACAICLAPIGHTSDCDMRNMVNGPPTINVVANDDAMQVWPDALLDSGSCIEHIDSRTISALRHSLREVDIPIELEALAKSCASLSVVKACVSSALEKRPGIEPSIIVRDVIATLAAFEDPSTNRKAGLGDDTYEDVSTNRKAGLDASPAPTSDRIGGRPPTDTPTSRASGYPDLCRLTGKPDSAPSTSSPRSTGKPDSRQPIHGNLGYDL
jgi:hypothetical protein